MATRLVLPLPSWIFGHNKSDMCKYYPPACPLKQSQTLIIPRGEKYGAYDKVKNGWILGTKEVDIYLILAALRKSSLPKHGPCTKSVGFLSLEFFQMTSMCSGDLFLRLLWPDTHISLFRTCFVCPCPMGSLFFPICDSSFHSLPHTIYNLAHIWHLSPFFFLSTV